MARVVTSLFGPLLTFVSKGLNMNKGLTVFLFHEVTENPSKFLESTGMWVSPTNFIKQIEWIQSNFEVIAISDLLDNRTIPENAAVITFDDAWAGILEAVESILIPKKLSSCLFTNLGTIESGVDHSAASHFFWEQKRIQIPLINDFDRLIKDLPMDENELFYNYQGPIGNVTKLKKLSQNPLFTIASHSYHHFDANQLLDDEFADQIDKNIRAFGENSIHIEHRVFAFPFGTPELNFEDRHLEILKQKGVMISFSGTCNRVARFNQTEKVVPRIHFSNSDTTTGHIWWACYKNQILKR
jgi:peptidoglycan/xylan/chitin deacetylase (PgdA/CDA1 family)